MEARFIGGSFFLLCGGGDFFRGVRMGVGARVGAPARQARSSVFWLSFKRARASECRPPHRHLGPVKNIQTNYNATVRTVLDLWTVFEWILGWSRMLKSQIDLRRKVARPCWYRRAVAPRLSFPLSLAAPPGRWSQRPLHPGPSHKPSICLQMVSQISMCV